MHFSSLLRIRGTLVFLLLLTGITPAAGAELSPETVDAYERYVAGVEQRFRSQAEDERFLWLDGLPEERTRVRAGEIVARPAEADGIMDVPDGLIHHWWGAAFIPDVTLEEVLAISRAYAAYDEVYDYIIDAGTVAEEDDRYWVYLRMERSASLVTAIIDLWTHVEYGFPRAGRAVAISNGDCTREVENAGAPDEHRLPHGEGSGYLWRANTLSRYLERDGGVYVELETIGLSRPFPPLLGWLIEPIARNLGRGSAETSLEQLRGAVLDPGEARTADARGATQIPSFWCTPASAAVDGATTD